MVLRYQTSYTQYVLLGFLLVAKEYLVSIIMTTHYPEWNLWTSDSIVIYSERNHVISTSQFREELRRNLRQQINVYITHNSRVRSYYGQTELSVVQHWMIVQTIAISK